MKELSLNSTIDVSLDRFGAFGETVQSRRRFVQLPGDWRRFMALCIGAIGFVSILYLVLSLGHEDVTAQAQADSVLCKQQ